MKEREMTDINISINPITGDATMKRAADLAELFGLGDGAAQDIVDVAMKAAQHTCTIRQVADVVQLDAHRLAPDPYVVEAVRKLLDLAESGELQALQWAGALSKGRTRVATVGQWGDVIQMLGASTMLKMHVEAMAMESMEEI